MDQPFLGQVRKDLTHIFVVKFRKTVVEEQRTIMGLLNPRLDDVDDFVFPCHK